MQSSLLITSHKRIFFILFRVSNETSTFIYLILEFYPQFSGNIPFLNQIFVFLDYFFCLIYFFSELSLFFFKGYVLAYPGNSLTAEVIALFIYMLIQYFRIQLASIGNKSEITGLLFLFIIMTFPVLIVYIYFLLLQTFCVIFELILNSIGLIILIVEIILSFFAIINITSHEKSFQ